MQDEPVPYSVFEAAVRVAGAALHFKRSLEQILRNSGVSENGYARHRDLSKYLIMRSIWDDLDRAGPRGRKVQHRIITALANVDRPEPSAPDQPAGRAAIADLRRLATEAKLLVSPEDEERKQRRDAAAAKIQVATSRRERLSVLNRTFVDWHTEIDRQRRGYGFERLLNDLFDLSELEHHCSYKTAVDQVDGSVTFEAFTYLVEARWRQDAAAASDLETFSSKVARRLDATRGMFISMAGFRDEAVQMYRLARDNRLILIDGQDLTWILEDRIDLADALKAKVQAAQVRGEPYLRLAEIS